MPTALITGAAGQDGFYLASHLRSLGYEVAGLVQTREHRDRQRDLPENMELITGDMTDMASLLNAIGEVQPDEVYNLAAVSSVRTAWTSPSGLPMSTGSGWLTSLRR